MRVGFRIKKAWRREGRRGGGTRTRTYKTLLGVLQQKCICRACKEDDEYNREIVFAVRGKGERDCLYALKDDRRGGGQQAQEETSTYKDPEQALVPLLRLLQPQCRSSNT